MKVMILAAGRGARLTPITDYCPKPLVPVLGEPLILRQIKRLKAAGYQQFVINVCYLKDQIMDYLGDGSDWQIQIEYSQEAQLLDVAGGVHHALERLGDKPFLLVSADIETNFPYESLRSCEPEMAHLVLVKNPEYHLAGDFGLKAGRLVPRTPTNAWTYANIGVYRPDFFRVVPQSICSLMTLLAPCIDRGLVTAQTFAGDWANIGTLKELHLLEQSLLSRLQAQESRSA